MRINPINTISQTQTNFKGYVNGKYYADSIIDMAKDALKNPKWESELRAKKSTFFKDYTTAHDDDLTTRIVAGIVSFGATEAVIAGLSALGAMSDDTEEKIQEIKDCIIDLLKSNK